MSDPLERLRTALADRYTVEREIGSGGMATVYLAHDVRHDRQVAVKVLRPDLAATLGPERFLREIKIAAQLQHPNILPLHDSGEADGFLYYVMPFVEGQSLRDKLAREGELPITDAVRVLRDVVDALTEAHAHGLVHRDIKPENILLRGRHALVTDFGVAKAVSEATGRQQLTTAGVALGTPAYMAPEQAYADPHLDHRVDIYAVGVVAYEMLTGRPVFMGTTPQQVLSAHVADTPELVTQHRNTVPPGLEQLVMRCLEKKPADRFQTADELLPLLESLTTPSGGMTPTDTRPLAGVRSRRRWLLPTVLAGMAAVIALVVVGVQLLKRHPISVTTSNIRAVTSEPGGEWMPALSPDGNQVAFNARRNGRESIVIRSTRFTAGGGEIVPTRGLSEGRERFPSWSPDGEFVRFRGCRGGACSWREVARLGGSTRPIGSPRDAATTAWSADGTRIAFRWYDSLFVYSVTDDATTLVAVPETDWAIHSPVFSPDDRRIAYVNGNPYWLTNFNVAATSIWVVDVDGGEPVRVTGEEHMDVSPAWLDADHLLFVSNRDGPREVYVLEVAAKGPRGEPQKVAGLTDARAISYSIAGRKLAFSKATARQNIWSYPIGPRAVSVGDGDPVTSENALIEEHDISPDGKWIAYDQNLRGNMDIYKRPIGGGSPMPVTDAPGDEFAPRWSPDGTEIAFYGEPSPGMQAVMVVSADGGAPVQLASGPWQVSHPRWSPNGLQIAFRADQTGQPEVWLVSRPAVGEPWGEPVQLTHSRCNNPHDWAPDGSGVLTYCRELGAMALVSPEGEVLRRLASSDLGLQAGSGWLKFSRDGSTLFGVGTHEDGRRGVWILPWQGGEPQLVVAYDDSEVSPFSRFSLGPDRVYVLVGEYESDIWVADVEVER